MKHVNSMQLEAEVKPSQWPIFEPSYDFGEGFGSSNPFDILLGEGNSRQGATKSLGPTKPPGMTKPPGATKPPGVLHQEGSLPSICQIADSASVMACLPFL